jgi:hypothetical protein
MVAVSVLQAGKGSDPVTHTIAPIYEVTHVPGCLTCYLFGPIILTERLLYAHVWALPPVGHCFLITLCNVLFTCGCYLNILLEIVFSDFPAQLTQFAEYVRYYLLTAYRPSTLLAVHQACQNLALFCAYFSLPFPHFSLTVLLSFMSFL